MRKLALIIFVLYSVCLYSQNNIAGYEYWFNSNFAERTNVPVAPADEYYLDTGIPTDGLSHGLNFFHLHFYDDSLRFSTPVSRFFYKGDGSLSQTNRIVAYRYWFNNNIADADTVYIVENQQVEINTEIDANSLSQGINAFHIQFLDDKNFWSSPLSNHFLFTLGHYINAYQYWFNSDFANAITDTIFPALNADIAVPIDVSFLENGLNIFHVRFGDEQGLWSSTISQFFFKSNAQTSDTSRIYAYKYWFDNDYDNAVTEYIMPAQNAYIIASVDASAISDGIHSFNIQFLDEGNFSSSAISSFFFKRPASDADTTLIVEYSYWFDEDFDNAVYVKLDTPVNSHDLIVPIDMTMMTKGYYDFNFRSKDTLGLWSSVITDNFYKNPYPIPIFYADITEFCDSGYVQFSNNSIDGDLFFWDLGDGNTSEEFELTHFFADPGEYLVSLTVIDTLIGLDSTGTLLIIVHPSYEFVDSIDICEGYVQEWRGNYLDTEGIYIDSLKTDFGCDSVFVLHLFVHPHYEFTHNAEICDNAIYSWRGNDYNVTGIYYDSLLSQYGCDSVYILNLLVHPTYAYVTDAEICDDAVYPWRGNSYNATGTYYDSLSTQYGCDSVFVLNLIVHPTYEFVTDAEICDDAVYPWRGNNYNATGTYYDSLSSQYGCDSVFVLNLIVHPTYEFVTDAEICDNAVFLWRGNSYNATGTYYDSLSSQYGCDSVFVLNLIVHPTYEFVTDAEICDNAVFLWRGNSYNATGTYYDSLSTQYGCDSVFVLQLTVNTTYEFTQTETICHGDTFSWRGHSLTAQGTFYDSLTTAQNCDSVYVLELTVKPVYSFVTHDTICEGAVYHWQGQSYTLPGTYYDSLSTISGCDSLFVLNLFVMDLPLVSLMGLDTFYCLNHGVTVMSGMPPGGTFSGQGVSGYEFNPTVAGIGTWPIVYAYTDSNGCTNSDTVWVEVNDCMGIWDNNFSDLSVFPNPTTGMLQIKLPSNGQYRIVLYGLLGQKFHEETFTGNNMQILDLNHLPSGIYLLKIRDEYYVSYRKVIIER